MKSILRRRRMIRALIQEIPIKPKRTRNRNQNKDYCTSNWMQMLDDPMLVGRMTLHGTEWMANMKLTTGIKPK
jgi:hypothetical protein